MSRFHELKMAMVEEARDMLAEDRARHPEQDPYHLVFEISEGLSSDVAVSIAILLRGDLRKEGIYYNEGQWKRNDRGELDREEAVRAYLRRHRG
jgi:hypothetical protein